MASLLSPLLNPPHLFLPSNFFSPYLKSPKPNFSPNLKGPNFKEHYLLKARTSNSMQQPQEPEAQFPTPKNLKGPNFKKQYLPRARTSNSMQEQSPTPNEPILKSPNKGPNSDNQVTERAQTSNSIQEEPEKPEAQVPTPNEPNLKSPNKGPNFNNQSSQTSNSMQEQPSKPEEDQFPTPNVATTQQFPLEKRRKSEIIRNRASRTGLVKPEPENFEIGWKRTKPTHVEKPKGYIIMDFLEKFEGLLGREFGSTALLAKAGEIVASRAREEAEVLLEGGEVEERMVTELGRVLKLMEMDLAMVSVAVKEETLKERVELARARCRQAILVANSF